MFAGSIIDFCFMSLVNDFKLELVNENENQWFAIWIYHFLLKVLVMFSGSNIIFYSVYAFGEWFCVGISNGDRLKWSFICQYFACFYSIEKLAVQSLLLVHIIMPKSWCILGCGDSYKYECMMRIVKARGIKIRWFPISYWKSPATFFP